MNYKEKIEFERQQIADRILEEIQNNTLEWSRGWHGLDNGAAVNAKTGKRYNGTNLIALYIQAKKQGYKDRRWLTFNQAKELGAQVKAGEKSTRIFHWNEYDVKTKSEPNWKEINKLSKDDKEQYILDNIRYSISLHSVFNAEQCSGLKEYVAPKLSAKEMAEQNEKIERVIANSAAPVLYDSENRAYYSTKEDKIHLPAIEIFKTKDDYYATALHEIAHSTGHASRLNRDMSGEFGSEKYAKEELRAEFASLFIQNELDLNIDGKHFENHSAYIQNWTEAIQEDKNVLFNAIKDAGDIATYVREHYAEQENTKKNEGEVMAEEQTKTDEERLEKILKERNLNEDKSFAKDTDYFGFGSLDALEKEHKSGYITNVIKSYSDWADESGRRAASDLSDEEFEFVQKHYQFGDMPDDVINKIVNEDNNYFKNKNIEAYKFTAYQTVLANLKEKQAMPEQAVVEEKKTQEKNKIEPLEIHHATEKAVLVKLAIAGEEKLKDTWWPKSRVDLDKDEKNVVAIDNYLQKQYGNVLSKQAEITAAAVGKSVATEQPKLSPMEYAQKMNNMRLDNLAKNVPAEMKALPNWCVLKIYKDKATGTTKKFIVNANNPQGGWAKHNDPSNWTTFDKAMEYARKNNGAGLSFAIKGSGFNAFDLDHCYDKETKTYNETAKKFLADLPNSYAERSVSGTGLHIFTKGSVCENGKYNEARGGAAVEVFETWGFVSMTGNVVDEQHKNLVDLPDEVKKSIQTEIGEKKVYQAPAQNRNQFHNYARSDSEVIDVIRKSKRSNEFESLMNGADLCGDHSRSDLRLMGILAYFTNSNTNQMETIFKQSKLYRPDKGDSYVERTAKFAANNASQQAR